MTDTFTSSPFVAAIEPITESDDEIRAFLADAEIPPLLPALAYATGDLSLLRPELRPTRCWSGMPQGGLSEEQQAQARALAFDALDPRSATAAAGRRRRPRTTQLLEIMELRGRRRGDGGRTSRCSKRSSRTAARTGVRPAGARTTIAPDVDFRVADHRRRACRACSPRTGCSRPACRSSSSRRTTTSAARGSRTPIPAAASTTRTTTTATRSRSATTGRCTSRPRTCCSTTSGAAPTRSGCASTSASRPRCVARRLVRRPTARGPCACATADGDEETIDAQRGHQRGRPAQPAVVPGHRRARLVRRARRSTRRGGTTTSTCAGKRVAVIGTGASAVQFIPEIAPEVGELARVPAHAAVVRPDPRLPRRGLAGLAVAVRPRPVLQRVEPLLDLLAHGRRRARCACAVDADWEPKGEAVSAANDLVRMVLTGYLGVEFADRPDLLEAVVPTYPPGAKRMLRDNGVWAGALQARQRAAGHRRRSREITPDGHRHRRRRRSTRST